MDTSDRHRPEPRELATLVPLRALGERGRERIAASARLHLLAAGESLDAASVEPDRSLYLIDGEVRRRPGDERLRGGEPAARMRIARGGDAFTVEAVTPARLVELDGWLVSTCLIWDPEEAPAGESTAAAALTSGLLRRIPPANVQRLAELLQPVEVASGEVVVREGDPGDYYYLIRRGDCEVLRATGSESEPLRVATLHPGDSFGEEALIADTNRNATVRMLGDGLLLRLTKDDFAQLIRDPLLRYVERDQAERLVVDGARWLDVRLPEEHLAGAPAGALNVPLGELRGAVGTLDQATRYVTCCNSGRRSAAAAFLLAERGFDTLALRGGLAAAPAGGGPRYDPRLAARTVRARGEVESSLHQRARSEALSRAAPDSPIAERMSTADSALRQAQRRALELESQLRAADAEAAARRQAIERSCEELRARTAQRLRQGEQRLAEYYDRAAREMDTLRADLATAETRHHQQRDAIDADFDATRTAAREQAARIRAAVANARRDAAQQAAALRKQLAARQAELRERIEHHLNTERTAIETALAASIAEQQRREREVEQLRRARIDAEREASSARQEIEREAAARREQEAEEVQRVEQRCSDARSALELAGGDDQALAAARRELEQATSDRRAVSECMAATQEVEETLRVQLLSEAEEWLSEERERAERELARARAEADELERIEARKAERERQRAAANSDMLSDVAAQLGADADDEPVLQRMIRLRAAEQHASLAREAGAGASAQREDAEAALARARERLRALQSGDNRG